MPKTFRELKHAGYSRQIEAVASAVLAKYGCCRMKPMPSWTGPGPT